MKKRRQELATKTKLKNSIRKHFSNKAEKKAAKNEHSFRHLNRYNSYKKQIYSSRILNPLMAYNCYKLMIDENKITLYILI
mmetsp:Transcript_10599/g.14606  ORF Transcript_10599/g.14606 Transcript_10599/m.14606 type:complete len:81 (-) Transcript_10599:317-559(-)